MEISETSYNIVRFINSCYGYNTDDLPCVQIQEPVNSTRIFVGFDELTGAPQYVTEVNASLLYSKPPPTHVIFSQSDLVLFIVGNKDSNVRCKFRWGKITHENLVLVCVVSNSSSRLPLQPCSTSPGWLVAEIPLTQPSIPSRAGFRGPWLALEVHTNLVNAETGLCVRIEHHHPSRVPFPLFWRKSPSVVAVGGYAGIPTPILKRQATAALAWMFATHHVLSNSGWDRISFRKHKFGNFKLMTFETNNPLHDDHEGKGAHWHFTLQNCDPTKDVKNVRPHFYLNEYGNLLFSDNESFIDMGICCVSIRTKSETSSNPSANNNNTTNPMFRQISLNLLPVFTLKNVDSGLFLHVDENAQEVRNYVVLSTTGMSTKGSRWVMLKTSEEGIYMLQNVRNKMYLHVRKGQPKNGNFVALWNKEANQGNWWHFSESGNIVQLQSFRSKNFLSVQNGKVIQQTDSGDSSLGRKWQMECLATRDWFSLVAEEREDELKVSIKRNSKKWCSFSVNDDTSVGILEVKKEEEGTPVTNNIITYDPLTGVQY